MLAFLFVMCFGLTRQLGHFIVARRDHLLYSGPDLGKVIPRGLLGDLNDEFAAAIRSSRQGRGILVTLSDKCHGCAGILDEARQVGKPDGVVTFALLNGSDPSFLSDVERHFDFVVGDPDAMRAKAAGLLATPFLLGVDDGLKLRYRGISSGLHDFVQEWTADSSSAAEMSAASHEDHPVVTHA
ncbi:MAG: hypothetical protein H0W90_15280 [Actinobacteria bacterium]|nr:hypothetical protein [Actinomycetota bacterium]